MYLFDEERLEGKTALLSSVWVTEKKTASKCSIIRPSADELSHRFSNEINLQEVCIITK